MLDSVLRRYKAGVRISVKTAISAILVVLAVVLPQVAHIAGGAAAGGIYLPMYAPALLAGCLLGWQWGLGVGIMSPVVSFGFTSLALGSAMPALSRLPYMIAELAVFGLVSGLFARKIEDNAFLAFPAVAVAQVSGRATYIIFNLIAGGAFNELLSTVRTGLVGLYIQVILVPVAVIALAKLTGRRNKGRE